MHKSTIFSVGQIFGFSKLKNKLKTCLVIFSLLTFSLFASAANAGHRADFVFIVDATGSMGGEISAVRTGLQSFVQGLDLAEIDARFAVVLYGGAPELVQDFSTSVVETETTFGRISVTGAVPGFQYNHNVNPEAGLEAIRIVLNVPDAGSLRRDNVGGNGSLVFRPDARINIILVTDEDADRPFYAFNRLPGQTGNEPPSTLNSNWQLEINNTAEAVIANNAFLNLLVNAGDNPVRWQYGDPDQDVADSNLLNYDSAATLANLEANGFGQSLQAQTLRAGLLARSFSILRVNSPDFINNFFAAKVEETIQNALFPVIQAIPNPARPNQTITLDATASFHQVEGRSIVAWDWDFNNDGIYDASAPVVTQSYATPGTYPVTLRITDDADTPAVATTVVNIVISEDPLPPTADAGGPYYFCPQVTPWQLSGSGSVNPDDGESEPGLTPDGITNYAWDLNNDGLFTDDVGENIDSTAFFTGLGTGQYVVRLNVTDNTANAFPSSGLGNQSDLAVTTVNVLDTTDARCNCLSDLAARPKATKVQLTWTDSGVNQYNVYRSDDGGVSYQQIAQTSSRYSTYLDLGLTIGTTYQYVVKEVNASGTETCQSPVVEVTPSSRRTRRNSPPTISSTPIVSAQEGTIYTYDVDAVDPDTRDSITYVLQLSPTGMDIDPTTGIITWTPTNAQVGVQTVTVRAVDGSGLFDQQIFTVSVANLNQAPQIVSSPLTTGSENSAYSYAVQAVDLDMGDILTYELNTSPVGMTINATSGLINWTPGSATAGVYGVTVLVRDQAGLTDTQTYQLTIAQQNLAPTITSLPVTNATESQTYQYDVDAIDPNPGDTISYALVTAPAGMTINFNTGMIMWVPGAANIGTANVTVSALDQLGATSSQTYTIQVSYFNDAPTITSAATIAATEGLLYQYDVQATDPDTPVGDELTYSLDVAPAGMSINSSTGLIQWIPGAIQIGSIAVTVRVTDTQGLFDTQSFNVTVANLADAPVIVSTPITAATEGQPYQYDVDATDLDVGDTITYSLNAAPSGMTINPATGLIQWTPSNAQTGANTAIVVATDSSGLSASQSFIITVANINDAPSITSTPNTAATEGLLYQYAVIATDPDVGDNLTYSLDTAPTGMTINASGVILWTPSEAQVGTQTATVRVTDMAGLADTQAFTVTVANQPNPPTFTSSPVTVASEGANYVYDADATDPDVGDILTYSLNTAPAGMAIDAVSGLIQWTPSNTQTGANTVIVFATDSSGLNASQSFSVTVANINEAPSIGSTPNTSATEGLLYQYAVIATDPDVGDNLTYSLDTAPAGVTINASGVVLWTPSEAQVGNQAVAVRVTDSGGLSDTQAFSVTVTNQPNPPVFTSTPIATASEGTNYIYDANATDPDVGDSLTYSLDLAPTGMTIDVATGVITWSPLETDIGTQNVIIRVTDSDSLFATQSYGIVVANVPFAPVITSTPVTTATVNAAYTYDVDATDADTSDIITFSLDQAVAGMSIDPTTGVISWTPVVGQEGLNNVTVRASDGTLSATQAFSISVTSSPNVAPTINSTPTGPATANQVYSYDVNATDSDAGDTLTYSLDVSPAGMTINAASGLVQWTPTDLQVANHPITVRVTDNNGGFATQSFTLTVDPSAPQSPPQINSTPLTAGVVGQVYLYDVNATDSNGDTITYSLTTAPTGMGIDSVSGIIGWTPTAAQVGASAVTVRASDVTGFQEQSYSVTVTDVALPLDVFVQATPNIIDQGATSTVNVFTSGGTGNITMNLTVNGALTPLDGTGNAVITGNTIGGYELIATATDSVETISTTSFFSVRDPSDTTPPTVAITAPVTDTEISEPVDIVGTADDTNLVNYRLVLAPSGTTNYTELNVSTTPVVNGVLGRLDPTLLVNGLYDVIVFALDANGQQSSRLVTYRIVGDMKVGNFSFTVKDLSIPLSGIPITINRTYDTRRKDGNLDFGFGWTVDYQNVKVEENVTPGLFWNLFSTGGFLPTWCIDPVGDHIVTVTLPGGITESFDISVSPRCNRIVPLLDVTLAFTGLPGATSSLVESSPTTVRYNGGQLLDIFGTVEAYNPDRYTLTTQEGYSYQLDQNFGVQRITDPNGNTLTYSANGIIHSSGTSVNFTRDTQGRITQVTDPNGNAINYSYNTRGDLNNVTDRTGNVTSYTYNRSHGLIDIIDPLGVRTTRSIYDNEGRLIAIESPDGSRTSISTDITGRQQVVTDRRGNIKVYTYDVNGNVLSETNALGETILRTHDVRGNLLTQTDPFGNTATYNYDGNGNELSESNALGETRSYSYDSRGNQLTETDSAGNIVETSVYDGNGNIISITDAVGNVIQNTFSANGNLTGITDPLGNNKLFSYDSEGNRLTETNERGVDKTYTYDGNNNETSVTTVRTDENGVTRTLTTSFTYDAEGRVTQEVDASGNVTNIEFNSAGKETARIDASGLRTEFEFDLRGNLILIRYADGTTETSTYDEENNKIAEIDRLGRATNYVFDSVNRLIQTNYIDGSFTSIEYDLAGRVTANVDQRGNRTQYAYDAANRRTSTTNALGQTVSQTYDIRGFVASITDVAGNTVSYLYDNKGRRTTVTYPNGSTTRFIYDGLGRKTSVFDQAGEVTSYGYDETGNVISITDGLGNTLGYQYNEQSSLISITNANGVTTRMTYDDLGRVTSRILPTGSIESFTYDIRGNVLTHTDFNGAITSNEYNSNNQLIRKIYPDTSENTYRYTATGQIESIIDGRGVTGHTYDVLDRLTRIDYPDGNFIQYTYDAVGNVITLQTPSGITAKTYDVLNRLITITDPDSSVTTYAYNAAGSRETVTYPNSITTEYTYNTLNQLTRLVNRRANNSVVTSYDYTLGVTGNRMRVVEASGRTVNYTYDVLYRLTQEVINDGITTSTIAYTYDAVGNRLTQSIDGIVTVNYTYDANDRLLTEGAINYTYDANGNTLTRIIGADATTYVYNSENRMIGANTPTTTIGYVYDSVGNRMQQTVNGVETNFLVDSNRDFAQVLEERDSANGLVVSYTYGDDLISQNRSGTISYYHYDGLGSTRALTNSTTGVTDTYDYDAFGIVLNNMGTTENNYLYTGEQLDPNVGFYYLRARYMNPNIGRFTTADPFPGFASDPVSLHKYQYADMDPVNKIDPTGNFSMVSVSISININFSLRSISFAGFSFALRRVITALVTVAKSGSLLVVREVRRCMRNPKRCRIDIPVLVTGFSIPQTSRHILDAQIGRGSSLVPSPAILLRRNTAGTTPSQRRWYNRTGVCNSAARNTYRTGSGGVTGGCDEYPYFTSQPGGPAFYPALVSLRLVNNAESSPQGGQVSSFYSSCGISSTGPAKRRRFLSFGIPVLPNYKWCGRRRR